MGTCNKLTCSERVLLTGKTPFYWPELKSQFDFYPPSTPLLYLQIGGSNGELKEWNWPLTPEIKSLDATESRTKLMWNFRILICHGSPSAVFRELKNGRELFPYFWNLSISKFGRIIEHVRIKSLRSSTKTNQNYNVTIYTGFYKRRLLLTVSLDIFQ